MGSHTTLNQCALHVTCFKFYMKILSNINVHVRACQHAQLYTQSNKTHTLTNKIVLVTKKNIYKPKNGEPIKGLP